MNSRFRRVAIVVFVAILSFQTAAAPRDERDDVGAKIVRVLKVVQRFFHLAPDDDSLQPPRP
jgi:hypothetical protein